MVICQYHAEQNDPHLTILNINIAAINEECAVMSYLKRKNKYLLIFTLTKGMRDLVFIDI